MTILAFIIAQTAIVGFYSLEVIESKFDATDFQYSDAYNRIFYNPHKVSDHVVLVSTDNCSRQEIAATIDSLEQACPKVIGVDILFSNSECDFDTSVSHIAQYDNTVFAAMMNSTDFSTYLEKSFFCEHLPYSNIGVVNSDAESLTDVVRTFTFSFASDSSQYWSFPVSVVNKAFPDLCKQFVHDAEKDKLNNKAIIYYQDVCFIEIPAGQIINSQIPIDWKSTVKDKIVLVGNLHDTQDMFITPVDRHMNGTRIHAYSVETILSGKHIRRVSRVVDWIIGVVMCWLLLLFNSFMEKELPKTGSLVMRLIQIIGIIMFLFLGCLCFRIGHFYIDFTPTILMFALSVFANDIWNGMSALVNKLKSIQR